MWFKQIILFLLYIGLISIGLGQNTIELGRFPSKAFTAKEISGSSQFFTSCQGKDGVLYFGSKQDVTTYNGTDLIRVRSIEIKDKTKNAIVNESSVSKLLTSSDGTIYVGRENNFGELVYSRTGQIAYKPLQIGDYENSFGSTWNIFEISPNKILFITEKGIYIKSNQAIKLISSNIPKGFVTKTSGEVPGGFFIVSRNQNDSTILSYLDKTTLRLTTITPPKESTIQEIRGSFIIGDTCFIVDYFSKCCSFYRKNKEFIWTSSGNKFKNALRNYKPTSLVQKNQSLYIGTNGSGILQFDMKGKLIRIFNDRDGLNDLVIESIMLDQENNLWSCLNVGVHFFEISSPVTFYDKKDGILGKVEHVMFANDQTYLSAGIGILESNITGSLLPFSSNKSYNDVMYQTEKFILEDGSQKILGVAYTGIFEFTQDLRKASLIVPEYGWKIVQSKVNKNKFYLCLENGISVIEYVNKKWNYKVLSFIENSDPRSMIEINNILYFNCKSKGIGAYNLTTSETKFYNFSKEKDNSNGYIVLFKNIFFYGSENNGLYTFDLETKKYKKFEKLKGIMGDGWQIFRLINIDDKELWISGSKSIEKDANKVDQFETGCASFEDNKWNWIAWPLAIFGNEYVVSHIEKKNASITAFGTANGFYIYNKKAIDQIKKQYTVNIDQITTTNNESFIFNPENSKINPTIVFKKNTINFRVHSNSYYGIGKTKFQYRLKGYDDWSEWTNENTVQYQRLVENSYIFEYRAKNIYGFESEIGQFKFTILPPWYRTWLAYICYIIAGLMGFLFILRLSNKRVLNQNLLLEKTVKERTQEIATQNSLLENQKEEIQQKTNDIVDSIVYAKRIQQTILPADEKLTRHFGEYFVFYRPKDIVSGDFYFSREINQTIIFAAVDCTGHGVPGALVSIVGNNGLLRSTNEFKLTKPSDILDKLREIVITAFRAAGQTDVKDGMDIALCSLNKETLMLEYAGANNECVIIRGNEIFELSPDKQPIGQFIKPTPFTNNQFQLQKGDSVYLYTDGYVDQFGGEKEKKFKSRPFKNMLIEIQHLRMEEQLNHITSAFDNWKGELDQIDDVCVFGIKI